MKFQLSFGEVSVRKATASIRIELRKIDTKYKNLETVKTTDFAERLTAINGGVEIDIKALAAGKASINSEDAKKLKEQVALLTEYTEAVQELRDLRTLDIARCVIDTGGIQNKEHRELVMSPVDSDFWRDQDLAEVEKLIKFFRDQFSG